jgi:hypothetical protein
VMSLPHTHKPFVASSLRTTSVNRHGGTGLCKHTDLNMRNVEFRVSGKGIPRISLAGCGVFPASTLVLHEILLDNWIYEVSSI